MKPYSARQLRLINGDFVDQCAPAAPEPLAPRLDGANEPEPTPADADADAE